MINISFNNKFYLFSDIDINNNIYNKNKEILIRLIIY